MPQREADADQNVHLRESLYSREWSLSQPNQPLKSPLCIMGIDGAHIRRSEERRSRVLAEQISASHVAAQHVDRLVPADLGHLED